MLRSDEMCRRTVLLLLACASLVSAQPAARRATNIAALAAYPGFFHQRAILVVGKVAVENNGVLRVSDEAGSIRVIAKGNAPEGLDEVRGEFWDLGRMKPDEPRLAGMDLQLHRIAVQTVNTIFQDRYRRFLEGEG